MVEVNVDQEFPDRVHYKDENGAVREQGVVYGWKPILCDKCNGYGHHGRDCVKRHKQDGPVKKVWVVKQKRMQAAPTPRVTSNVEKGVANIGGTSVKNRFDVLTEASTAELFYDVEPQREVEPPKEDEVQGCEAPDLDG